MYQRRSILSTKLSDKIDQSYQTAVHIAYAIVLTQTFEMVSNIFKSPSDFLSNQGNYTFLYLPPLILAYTFFVTSWIGYTRSISNHGYKEGVYGTIRFLTDLFVVFLIFELLNQISIKNTSYGDMFLLMPVIFFVYIIWDLLKYGEHHGKDHYSDTAHRRRISITINYALSFIGMMLFYTITPVLMMVITSLTNRFDSLNFINWKIQAESFNDYWWNFIFVIFAIVLMIFYRKAKWTNMYRKARRKNISR